MDERIKKELVAIVGEDNYTDRTIDVVVYSYDASEHSGRPLCAIWPENTEQVSAVLQLANREKIAVTPRGAGTGLAGAAVPARSGIVMDLARMNRILKVSVEDRLAIVQPGVVYDDLDRVLRKEGYFFPPDPSSGKACTIGGNVATNAGGVKGAKYGTTRDYVLGLIMVLPDGRIMKTGAKTMKSASGFDLTRLFVGSEGMLGVVTEVTLKINPVPTFSTAAMAVFDRLEDAGNTISQIMRVGVIPSVLEIMDIYTIRAINQNTELNLPEVPAVLLAETDGYTSEDTKSQMDKVISVFKANNARDIRTAETATEKAELFKARKSAYAVLARIGTHFVLEDVTVPISNIPALLTGIQEIAQKYDLKIATFGHAGDGNLHPQIIYDGYNPDEVERTKKASADLFRLAIALEGTLTGEHGIGLSKAPFMTLEHDPVAMDVMQKIKTLLDPNNILNPGKMALEG